MFFAKAVDAQIEFSLPNLEGKASQLTLHQSGRQQTAQRLEDAEAKDILNEEAVLAERIKQQKAMPETEQAVRRALDELRAGEPAYDRMSPGLAAATRQQLPQLQAALKQKGDIQAATFKGVAPSGADIYQVKFERGTSEARIALGRDGKIENFSLRLE